METKWLRKRSTISGGAIWLLRETSHCAHGKYGLLNDGVVEVFVTILKIAFFTNRLVEYILTPTRSQAACFMCCDCFWLRSLSR